jgi:DNA-binding transcriptional MerR regulator
MNASYSIPETAKLTGIPEHAIREYAKQFADVLPEPETKSDSGRSAVKRYPDAALAIFRSIRKLKDEGLDSAQIRESLNVAHAANAYSETGHMVEQVWADLHATEESAAPAHATTLLIAEDPNESEWQHEDAAAHAEALDACAGESTYAAGEEAIHAVWEGISESEAAPVAQSEPAEPAPESAEASSDTWQPDAAAEADTIVHEETAWEAASAEAGEASECWAEETAGSAAQGAIEAAEASAIETHALETPFHPLFTNLNDGLRQLRKIMDENMDERESLRVEREALLADTAAKQSEIEHLKWTVTTQEEKIGGLQSALNVLMAQCDQQLQAIRSALGQA